MLSVKSIIFIGLFFFCSIGALFSPYLGVYGYLAEYSIGPANQWWEAPFSGLGLRYSFTLAICTIIGVGLQRNKLRFGFSILQSQEILVFLFLLTLWIGRLIGVTTIDRYSTVDHPTIKYLKVVIFIFLMTHVITDTKKLNGLMWVFVFCALILGLQAWDLPRRAFVGGRLEGIGGSDFDESNFFAAYMAAMLPLIGIQLIRSKRLLQKLICLASAAFTANTIILCRSRGAFVGIALGGIVASLFSPRKYRKIIAIGIFLGIIGGFYVTDKQFLERMTTIVVSENQERDMSAQGRLFLWKAAFDIIIDNPLGIGVGNWHQTIGSYDPSLAGRDVHNTYIKCMAEAGIHGFLLFFGVIAIGLYQLRLVKNQSEFLPLEIKNDLVLFSFGIFVSIVILLGCVMTISMIYTEILWILITLPTCLRRSYENSIVELYLINQKNSK